MRTISRPKIGVDVAEDVFRKNLELPEFVNLLKATEDVHGVSSMIDGNLSELVARHGRHRLDKFCLTAMTLASDDSQPGLGDALPDGLQGGQMHLEDARRTCTGRIVAPLCDEPAEASEFRRHGPGEGFERSRVDAEDVVEYLTSLIAVVTGSEPLKVDGA